MESGQSLRWLVSARRHPSSWLLLTQLAGVVLYPAMEGTAAGRALFGALGILVLVLALWVVNRSAATNWIAWCLAIPSVLLSLLAAVAKLPGLVMYAYLLESALYFYTAAGLIAYMLRDHRVTRDELYATAATFTLLAWGFAFAFAVCQAWYPGSFAGMVEPARPRTWFELLFLSFSTLSSVGIGDIVPVSAPARSLVMLASFAGVMYIALVVSRLIGLATLRREGEAS